MIDAMIGMVLGSEAATPLAFWFAVAEGTKVQLDDIVYIAVDDPAGAGEAVYFYGVVDEVRRSYEGVQFDGDTELVVEGLMPANISYAAHVLVTRVEPEDFIPPGPGDLVYLAQHERLDKALYLDNMDAPLPAGVLRNGEPAYINFDFINGSKGAHINISGISGIATKTSYALFLLYSIFHAKKRGLHYPLVEDANTTKAIIFNVKGSDLLFLNKANARFEEEEGKWQQKRRMGQNRYELCDLPVKAFSSVAFHAPARSGENLMPDSPTGTDAVPYAWTVREFCEGRMLPFVLTERDAMTNLGFLVGHIEEKLAKLAQGQKGTSLEVEEGDEAFNPNEPETLTGNIDKGIDFETLSERTGRLRLESFDDLVSYLEFKLLNKDSGDDEGKSGGDRLWTAGQARATREALIRRLRGASRYLRQIIRGDLSTKVMAKAKLEILNSDKQVHVIDINSLAPLAQMFVVGSVLKQVFEEKETGRRGQVFIVLDELNKYAPAEGSSPIKDVLLDIAERGRSMGIILIGAQQTASEVERRVVGNAAIRIVGRLDAAEADRPEYKFMPRSFLGRSTILAPGTMIVHQPDVPSPMMLNFPFPAWATRLKEVKQEVSDEEATNILG